MNGQESSPGRRPSWLSNISSKFSSSPTQSPPQASNVPPKQGEISVPKANPAKNAVLQHAARYQGEGPYTPAPPKSGQPGLLQVFRRLSSSSGHATPGVRGVKGTHGLVERKVLNVDHNRERCTINDLNQSRLRRVAFCVDVEIAPMPRYADVEPDASIQKAGDKTQKRKLLEKGEGEALKRNNTVDEPKGQNGDGRTSDDQGVRDSEKGAADGAVECASKAEHDGSATSDKTADSAAKKKEKKKRNEEERRGRKERKRKLAEANGSMPMEIYLDSDSSAASTPTTDTAPRPQLMPTTNPVRIYRRCCQLRETPILKKITEQLMNPSNFSSEQGMVERLDLTAYWLQLPDLIALGDYLAVVPIKEVILENCGLTDEGLRVVLAGLLAAKKVEKKFRRQLTEPDGLTPQGGAVERLVLKNNKIGPEGWKHLCLFIYLCRSLKALDVSNIHFPHTSPAARSQPQASAGGTPRPALTTCQLLAKSIAERTGGSTLELLNFGETGIRSDELGHIIDALVTCGVSRLGLAHNDIDSEGVQHIARYIKSGRCQGLDLAGNEHLREDLDVLANAIDNDTPLWGLSLAACDLAPRSLSKLFPKLTKLSGFHFIDLSHNRDLFRADPSAIHLLRKYERNSSMLTLGTRTNVVCLGISLRWCV